MPLPTLPTASLFDLYKAEKADFEDDLTEFPTFRIWKETYLTEREEEMDSMDVGDVYTMDDEAANEEIGDSQTQPKADQPKPVTKPKSTTHPTKKKKLTNMDRARKLYQELFDKGDSIPPRRDTISAFVSTLNISKACASTYEYNIKQKYVGK